MRQRPDGRGVVVNRTWQLRRPATRRYSISVRQRGEAVRTATLGAEMLKFAAHAMGWGTAPMIGFRCGSGRARLRARRKRGSGDIDQGRSCPPRKLAAKAAPEGLGYPRTSLDLALRLPASVGRASDLLGRRRRHPCIRRRTGVQGCRHLVGMSPRRAAVSIISSHRGVAILV